jgi:hypothetical protein
MTRVHGSARAPAAFAGVYGKPHRRTHRLDVSPWPRLMGGRDLRIAPSGELQERVRASVRHRASLGQLSSADWAAKV